MFIAFVMIMMVKIGNVLTLMSIPRVQFSSLFAALFAPTLFDVLFVVIGGTIINVTKSDGFAVISNLLYEFIIRGLQ